MNKSLINISINILAVLLFSKINAQDTTTTNFYNEIKSYDFSTILSADSIIVEDGKDKIKRAEILGFIGDKFERLHIHFVSIIQNQKNPYEYLVYGKTMVNETTCSFQGTILIKQTRLYKNGNLATYKEGFAICEVFFQEDIKQASTGYIKGELKTNFIIDDKQQFRYDALSFGGDGFSNNEFTGTWTSYRTNISKKCNWGDYRIPDCGDLDVGAGQFSVSEKYLKNGWVSYVLENMVRNDNIVKRKKSITKNKESKQWWE